MSDHPPSFPTPELSLWNACTDGHLAEVQRLCALPGIDVNWPDPQYWRTPFYRACSHNHVAVVEFLLRDPRVDVNRTQSQKGTPLNIACQDGFVEVVKVLLRDARTEVNIPDVYGATPLWVSCQNGLLDIVKWLILCRPDSLDCHKPTAAGGQLWHNTSPSEIAERKGHAGISSLIRSFLEDPASVIVILTKEFRLRGLPLEPQISLLWTLTSRRLPVN